MYARHISPISRRMPEIRKEGEGNGNAQAKIIPAFGDRSLQSGLGGVNMLKTISATMYLDRKTGFGYYEFDKYYYRTHKTQ